MPLSFIILWDTCCIQNGLWLIRLKSKNTNFFSYFPGTRKNKDWEAPPDPVQKTSLLRPYFFRRVAGIFFQTGVPDRVFAGCSNKIYGTFSAVFLPFFRYRFFRKLCIKRYSFCLKAFHNKSPGTAMVPGPGMGKTRKSDSH